VWPFRECLGESLLPRSFRGIRAFQVPTGRCRYPRDEGGIDPDVEALSPRSTKMVTKAVRNRMEAGQRMSAEGRSRSETTLLLCHKTREEIVTSQKS
jgi:hypothetical protein